ncbi:hypothetical protein BKA67DRAFT_538929 [Truncatella angustata]|uniref:Uncharacterized protein n=1 Tax=Truncatella angustata TaxID=152316 RepID=A0A9P8ZTE7_9PEZI|nr:uncharacterized protein BKA67DRAFT_538929 [Truncatella angustata]KAH6648920.1 hypothetical protein BKA67DRAFT_538929 [Truncatella angustata]
MNWVGEKLEELEKRKLLLGRGEILQVGRRNPMDGNSSWSAPWSSKNIAVNSQGSSPLFGLPREIYDAIYYELWQSVGVRHHIFWHENLIEPHQSQYCLWSGITGFSVEDSLQLQLEQVWDEHGCPNTLNCDKITAIESIKPEGAKFDCPCLVRSTRVQYTYLTMMLSCKLVHKTIEMLLGKRATGVFHRHIRHLELSVVNEFTSRMLCCTKQNDEPHTPYDFLWLNLAEMINCRQIDIWIVARRHAGAPNTLGKHVCFTSLSASELENIFLKLADAIPHCEVTVTSPLGKDISPEQGFVDNLQLGQGIHLWKRYTGDKFRSAPGFRIFQKLDRYMGT